MRKYEILFIVTLSCIFMGIIDAIIQPGYAVKSGIKIILFMIVPIIYYKYHKSRDFKKLFIVKRDGIRLSLLSGFAVYSLIILAYMILNKVCDFSSVVTSLNKSVGVNSKNFIYVAIYISFINSLLEEFFFRGFSFFTLRNVSSRTFAYIFSSAAFALYHVSMMIGWFNIWITLLAISGLFVGGIIFNFFNEKSENIYTSWLIHMFANFAINSVGFMLFNII